MAVERGIATAELGRRLEQEFPFTRIRAWTKEMVGIKEEPEPDGLMDLVRSITMLPGFRSAIIRYVSPFEIDVKVTRPSTGQLVEILHGSFFHLNAFALLEDPRLNRVLKKTSGQRDEVISRGLFNDIVSYATVPVATLVLAHDLNQADIETITKHHCLKGLVRLPEAGSTVETAVLFYGAMKVVANKLEYAGRLS